MKLEETSLVRLRLNALIGVRHHSNEQVDQHLEKKVVRIKFLNDPSDFSVLLKFIQYKYSIR